MMLKNLVNKTVSRISFTIKLFSLFAVVLIGLILLPKLATMQGVNYTINGNVKAEGANPQATTVSLTGTQTASVSTGSDGNYSFTVPAGGNYTVSVYKSGINFNPASQTFNNLQANQIANFQNGVPLCAPPSSGLVGWWKGENSANDSSGNSLNGSLINGTTYATAKVGQSFNFDGTDDFVNIADNPSLNPQNITVNAWIYPRAFNTGKVIVAKDDCCNISNRDYLLQAANNQVNFAVFGTSGNVGDATGGTLTLNAWNHVAGTYDGSFVRVYLNGALVASNAFSQPLRDSATPVWIGRTNETAQTSRYFNGQIDEAQIYNRALTASEIAAIYNAGSAGVCTAAQIPAANGKIAFASYRTGNYEIFTMNADGSNQTNVSNNGADDYEPAWSPDGSKIAFTSNRNSNRDIYVMNADGSNQQRLTTDANNDYVSSWSPDGTKIVFYSDRTGGGDIYVMNAAGSNQTRLTTSTAQDFAPKFSPDGSKIVFQSIRDGNYEIYVMNADGSNQTRLTNNSAYDEYPAFSPDGSKIVFDSGRTGNYEIFVMNADGSNQVNLSNNPANDYYPAWSPDGTTIIFRTTGDGNGEIYSMNTDGSNQTRLTINSTSDDHPSWQPIRLAFNTGDGTLDSTFNGTGKVTLDLNNNTDEAYSVKAQSDGKIIVSVRSYGSNLNARNFELIRFNNNGSVDNSFGTSGRVSTDFAGFDDFAYSIAIQGDGKIVAAGQSSNGSVYNFALARYNPDGSLDTSFGNGGKVITTVGTYGLAHSVVIQSDGKIIAAGYGSGTNNDFALVRYNTDGSLDTTFGTGGKVITDFSGVGNLAYSVAVHSDGKIVAAGISNGDFAVARYNSNGVLDSSFGTGGKVTTQVSTVNYTDQAESVVIQTDGKIIAAGWSFYTNSTHAFTIIRYDINGALDASFGTGGKVITSIGGTIDEAYSAVLQSDGKIVAVGRSCCTPNYDFSIVRYNSNGTLDNSFGNGGKILTAVGNSNDFARAVTIQPDGKIVAAGSAGSGSVTDLALARYNTANSSSALASNVNVTFANVMQAGNTLATPIAPSSAGALPSGYSLMAQSIAYDIRTSAQYSGNITVSFNVPNVPDASTCTNLRLLHYETSSNQLENVTTGTNSYNAGTMVCTVTGQTTSLSPFVIAQVLAPTAATVSISGRVITPQELGLTNALVTLTDMQGNSQTVMTGKGGGFRFTNVIAGETYILSVSSKRYTYVPQVITVTEDIVGLTFNAQ